MFPLDTMEQLQCLNWFLKLPNIHRKVEWISMPTLLALVDCVQRSTDLKILKMQSSKFQPPATVHVPKIARALAGNTTLRVLSFESTRITEASTALASSLKVNSTLVKLNLSKSGIKDEGVSAIGEALAVNSGLTTLKLSFNLISNLSIGPFSTGLQTNFTLKRLDLGATGLQFESASAIVAALKPNAALTHLDLQENPLFFRYHKTPSDEALKGFLTNLSQIPSLTTLRLGCTDIRQKQLSMILTALSVTINLKSLHLGGESDDYDRLQNKFDADSTREIAHTINNSLTNLSTLDLSFTGITAEGIMPIAEALKTNSTLTELNLKGNPLGDEGAGYLAAMLATNSTLTTLSLRDSDATVRLRDNLINRHYGQNAAGLDLELPILLTTEGLKSLDAAMTVNTAVTRIDLHSRLLSKNTRIESHMMIRFKDNKTRGQSLFTQLFDHWSSELTSDVS